MEAVGSFKWTDAASSAQLASAVREVLWTAAQNCVRVRACALPATTTARDGSAMTRNAYSR